MKIFHFELAASTLTQVFNKIIYLLSDNNFMCEQHFDNKELCSYCEKTLAADNKKNIQESVRRISGFIEIVLISFKTESCITSTWLSFRKMC